MNAQEIGANFNHDPEIIDFEYLKKIPVEWIRTTHGQSIVGVMILQIL